MTVPPLKVAFVGVAPFDCLNSNCVVDGWVEEWALIAATPVVYIAPTVLWLDDVNGKPPITAVAALTVIGNVQVAATFTLFPIFV